MDLDVISVLGEGKYGKALLVEDKNGKKYVAKIATKEMYLHNLINEYNILSVLSVSPSCHPLVVCMVNLKNMNIPKSYFEHYFVNKKKFNMLEEDDKIQVKGLLLEYIKGITLFDYLDTNTIDLELFLQFARYLIKGVTYMHSKGVVHRDIKPENIMITDSTVKFIDFGGSCVPSDDYQPCVLWTGTLDFASPEMLYAIENNFPNDYVDYYKADIWSLGITLYEMLTRHTPWGDNDDDDKIAQAIKTKHISTKGFPLEIKKLFKMMLNRDVDERASGKQLIKYLNSLKYRFSEF